LKIWRLQEKYLQKIIDFTNFPSGDVSSILHPGKIYLCASFWGSLDPKVDVFSMFGMFGIVEITKCGDIDIKFHQPH